MLLDRVKMHSHSNARGRMHVFFCIFCTAFFEKIELHEFKKIQKNMHTPATISCWLAGT